jgi:thiamine monophosphate synthase
MALRESGIVMAGSRYAAAGRLARLADALDGPPAPAPRLFAFTDPERTPDLQGLATRLPPGTGLVLRTFGRAEIEAEAHSLAEIAREGGLVLLIAGDPELAMRCGASGVHWPQARLGLAARWRRRFALMTASAHDPGAARRAARVCDLVFVSPAFASASRSAGRPMGPFRMAAYARRTPAPVYALGGVNRRTAARLFGLNLSGLAGIDGIMG